jgi:hypothetical protein
MKDDFIAVAVVNNQPRFPKGLGQHIEQEGMGKQGGGRAQHVTVQRQLFPGAPLAGSTVSPSISASVASSEKGSRPPAMMYLSSIGTIRPAIRSHCFRSGWLSLR